MSLIETKKTPFVALPFLKKRLRRITALGLRKLDIKDFNFAVYFTLHRTEKTVAFYTSEAIENQRSPEWSYLKFPFRVQCLEEFFMRVWIKSGNQCRPFLEYDIHLEQSLMPDEQKDDSTQSNNSLWIEMFGYRFSDDESTIGSLLQPTTTTNGGGKKSNTKRVQYLKSYTSLSIQRMMSSIQSIEKEKLESKDCLDKLQILVKTNDEFLSQIKERESRQLFIERLREYLQCQTTAHDQRLQVHQQRQETINERKIRLSQNLIELLNQQEELKLRTESVKQSKLTLYDLMQLILYRQKSIVRDIYTYVYPITAQNKNEYTIANIKLPPAEDKIFQTSLNREKIYEIEAAVGFSAHLVLIISQFMQLPLRFPIECYGTAAVKIHDHISTSTSFSLDFSSKNEVFSYAFYLLNRNIGQILEHFHMGNRNTDYRRTLENLKEILDRCFVPSLTNHKIEPKSPNLPVSNEIPIPIRKFTNLDRSNTRSSRNSTLTPVFRSLNSSSSSLAESNQFDQSVQTDRDLELYPRSNTISPRLTMQFSVMPPK